MITSAWPDVLDAISLAQVPVRVLDVVPSRDSVCCIDFQVSTGSVLGALALNCGGLVVDHGWLRVLGGGDVNLPDLAQANGLEEPGKVSVPPPWLVVAYDVLGGVFAVDGGLNVGVGEVCHRGPDTLRWEGLGAGHGAFVASLLAGHLDDFWGPLRWPGWEQEVEPIGLTQGLPLYPPPFTREGQDLSAISRRAVPFSELLSFYDTAAGQLANLPDGESFQFRLE